MLTTTVQACIVLAIESYVSINSSIIKLSRINLSCRYLFAKFQLSIKPHKKTIPLVKTVPTYLTLFIFGFLYQLVLVYDSLRLKNTIQVIGICIYNVGMLIYASIQYDQIHKTITGLAIASYIKPDTTVWADMQPYLVAVPCIIAFFTIVLSVIAWKLYDEFAWTIYKHISADLRMKRRFLTFQVRIEHAGFTFSY